MNLGVWLAMGRDATYVVRAAGAAASASTSTDRRRSTVRSSTPWSAPPRSSRRSVSAIPRSPPRTDLIRSSIPFVAAAQSPNEYGFAMGLETMNSLVPISGAAASLSFASAPGAFNVLAGDLHSSLRTNLVENAYDLGPAVVSRLDSAACVARAGGQVVSYATGQPAANDDGCYSDRRAAWIQAFDSWSSNGGSDGVSGLLDSSGGLVGGVDAPAPGGWRVGGLIGYVHSTFSADSTAANGSADNVSVGAYAGHFWGQSVSNSAQPILGTWFRRPAASPSPACGIRPQRTMVAEPRRPSRISAIASRFRASRPRLPADTQPGSRR
jgi:uncharacterized protein with beta-barrel porin domain